MFGSKKYDINYANASRQYAEQARETYKLMVDEMNKFIPIVTRLEKALQDGEKRVLSDAIADFLKNITEKIIIKNRSGY